MNITITNPNGVKLKTVNKYCPEDIDVFPILQEKTATLNNVDITADEGYAGLSTVHVALPEEGAKLNIAYSQTAPADTSKLWIKANKPTSIDFSQNPEQQVEGIIALNAAFKYGSYDAYNMAAAKVGTKIYAFGGYYHSSDYNDSIYEFDTETKTVTKLSTNVPTSLVGIAAATVGTKIYLLGGAYSTSYGWMSSGNIYEFDTETKQINSVTKSGSFNIAYAAIGVYGTNIYLFGGRYKSSSSGSENTSPSIIKFDTVSKTITSLSGKWLKYSATGIAAATIGNKIYLFGGISYGYNSNTTRNTIQIFDCETETITSLNTQIPFYVASAAATAVGNKIFLFGGGGGGDTETSSSSLNKICEFDTITNSISLIETTLTTANSSMAAVANGTNVYIFPGSFDKGTYEFIVNFPLEENNILIQEDYLNNMFDVLTVPTKISVGVKNVYKGNSNNVAEFVDAYLHNGTAWVNINTGAILS